MLIRLWLFTERPGNYPEGGTYDTSVLDSETGNCSDPHQEIYFQNLLEYANARGEELQEVESADEAYSLCSRNRINTSPTACGGGYVPNESTFMGSITRPIPSLCNIPVGGGSRNSTPVPCPPVPPVVPPEDTMQPMQVITQSDNARRIIALARQNRIVPTIGY